MKLFSSNTILHLKTDCQAHAGHCKYVYYHIQIHHLPKAQEKMVSDIDAEGCVVIM